LEGQGQEIAIPHGSKLRPVEAVRTWLEAAGITEGPIFRSIARGGRMSEVALSADAVPDVVKDTPSGPASIRRCLPGTRCAPGF
jgi:hypothetical protein